MQEISLAELSRQGAPGKRLFGFDVGSRTIGVAISDATWTVATPLVTVKRTRMASDAERLRALAMERQVGGLVVGLPVQMDGREGPRCQSVRQFVRNLQPALPLPVIFWDERLSTAAVERVLIGEADLGRQRRGQVVDRAAAAWILQGALDALAHVRSTSDSGPGDRDATTEGTFSG